MLRYPERDKLPLESIVNLYFVFFSFSLSLYLETMTREGPKVFACPTRLNLKRDLFALESLVVQDLIGDFIRKMRRDEYTEPDKSIGIAVIFFFAT